MGHFHGEQDDFRVLPDGGVILKKPRIEICMSESDVDLGDHFCPNIPVTSCSVVLREDMFG